VVHISISPIVIPNRKFMMYLISLFTRSKLIINYHGDPRTEWKINFSIYHLNSFIYLPNYILTPFILKSADLVVVNSIYMEKLFKSKYGANNVVVIPNGIDSSWINYKKIDNQKNNSGESISLFYHGRLAPEKGLDLLLRAISNVLKDYEINLKLYIAGDGVQKKHLKKLSIELGIETKVIFLGNVSQSKIKSYLNLADAAIYPSIHDAFSLAVLEAFAVLDGPVMYSNKIGINDFVTKDGYNFYTFNPTVEAISDCLEKLINRKYDDNVSYKQKEFAKSYTWNKITDKYAKLYQKFF
jgi:glycosyltransferase involved in cell wall biosynthesis